MTAILNFTQPSLDVPANKGVAPGATSSKLSVEAPQAATSGNQGRSINGNGKEFGKVLNTRIAKKETGREGNIDSSEPKTAGSKVENTEFQTSEQIPGVAVPARDGTYSSDSKRFGVKSVTDSLLGEAEVKFQDSATKARGTTSESMTVAGIARNATSSAEQIARGGVGPVDNRTTPISFNQSESGTNAPTGSGNTVTRPDSQSLTNEPEVLISETHRATKSVQDEALSLTVRNEAGQRSASLPLANGSEELISEPYRMTKSVPGDEVLRAVRREAGQRPDAFAQTGVSEVEVAATNGKQLPDSGKPLPSVLLQTPAQYAPGLNARTDLMTRSLGIGRQQSTGKDIGEAPGLEKVTQVNSRFPLSELFGKAISQAQPSATADTGMNTQTSSGDSPASGLLAQHQAGVERVPNSRISGPLTGLDSNQTFSQQLQPGGLEMSAQLGSRIRWMSNFNISSAEMKLYPAELGTLEILITAEDDLARVNFVTSTSAAKEMIEASLPRLRELLAQSGLLLEHGDVAQRDLSQNNSSNELPVSGSQVVESLESEALEQVLPIYQRSADEHQIDHFA